MNNKKRIVITVEGGVVANVETNFSHNEYVDVEIIDRNNEYCSDDDKEYNEVIINSMVGEDFESIYKR